MKNEADLLYLVDYIEGKIKPKTLSEIGKSSLSVLLSDFGIENIIKAIDISFKSYINFNSDGSINVKSVQKFLSKIGGIAHNNSLSPIEQKKRYINNYGCSAYDYWNSPLAINLINKYTNALKSFGYSDNQIVEDLNNEIIGLFAECSSWTQWKTRVESWIIDIGNWGKDTESESIVEEQSILPKILYSNTRNYIEQLSKQINSSYENNLYDCTAVIMRRLMEILLILSFQKNNIEKRILDKSGQRHLNLEKIIKVAINDNKLKLSINTKTDMDIFRELGNLSAHKIWYNCTKKDIESLILKYRAIIEELLYKAEIKH